MKPAPTSPLKQEKMVKDFWPRFKRASLWLIVILQLLILVALALLLTSTGALQNNPLGTVATLVAQSVLGVVASLIVYRFVARPIKYILAALVHISGEPTAATLPNPNEKMFEKIGFAPVLKTVYQLAADAKDPIAEGNTVNVGAAIASPGQHAPKPCPDDFLRTALDQSVCGFVILDSTRAITYASKAAPINIDTNGTQSLGLMFNESDTLEKWWDDCDDRAVHAEKTWPRIPDKLPDAEDRRFFDVIASYDKGASAEMVVTLIDRTHLYTIGEEELDFIAFAAHELRGPITVIRGYIDVLSDELSSQLEDDQKELFRRLAVSATRLSGYVNNILNTSRYDRRHLRVHLSETTVGDVYSVIRDDMDLRASSQGRLLSITIPNDLPTIAADTSSLSEVFSNLIDNAIKYSNEGGTIDVTASSRGDTVEIAVEDHGIGMPASVVGNLFHKFYRSHRSRETVAGTGIGLYISKGIVESHGGTISVRSEDGHGSTFTVSLPAYKMIADKIKADNNGNQGIMKTAEGSWIKNHTMYRG